MAANQQRPTSVVALQAWFVIGGLIAFVLGAQLGDLFTPDRPLLWQWQGVIITGFGFDSMDAIKLVGYLLLLGGLLMLGVAYLIQQRDQRSQLWGTIASALVGACLLLPSLMIIIQAGTIVGATFATLVAGALGIAAAVALNRYEEIVHWVGSGRSKEDPRDREIASLRSMIRELQRTIDTLTAQLKRQPQSAGGTIVTPPAAPLGWLVNRTRGTSKQPVGLEEWNKLGRNPDCTVALHSPSAGREHAVISFENGRYYISDMNSKTGTFVNGQRITEKRQLFENDEIKMGDDVFVFLQARPQRS